MRNGSAAAEHDQDAAHRRRALLGPMSFQALLADVLPELVAAEELDEQGPTMIDRTIARRAMTFHRFLRPWRPLGLARAFKPGAAGRLHEHHVAGPHHHVDYRDRVVHGGRVALLRGAPTEVAAGQLADGDETSAFSAATSPMCRW